MAEQPRRPMTAAEIEAHLESHTRPRRFGPHYADLVEAIDEELRAQLALGVLGDSAATRDQRRILAELIADEVDWRFRLDPRVPPGEDERSHHERSG
jgi:hypothetical protein